MSRISQQHADRRKNLAFHFQVRSPSFPKINLRRISSLFFHPWATGNETNRENPFGTVDRRPGNILKCAKE